MDAALDVLRMIRFTGGIFLDAEFSAPWCVAAQVTPEDCRPFTPVPGGILAYHYVSAGRLLLQVDPGVPVGVSAGHIVLLPRNDPHVLGSELGCPPVSVDHLMQPMIEGGPARIVYGGGGDTTRLLCGFLHSEMPGDALIGVLPSVMTLDVAEGAAGSWIESSFRFAATELAAGTVRSPDLLARLAELHRGRTALSRQPAARAACLGRRIARSVRQPCADPTARPSGATLDDGSAGAPGRSVPLGLRRAFHGTGGRAANALSGQAAIERVTVAAFRKAPHSSHTEQHIVLLRFNRRMTVLLFHAVAVILHDQVYFPIVTEMDH